MLQLSLNEIFSETQKALRSVNIEWGIAKDCAACGFRHEATQKVSSTQYF